MAPYDELVSQGSVCLRCSRHLDDFSRVKVFFSAARRYCERPCRYYAFMDSREYYNVLPSELAQGHLDAGKITCARFIAA